MPEQKTAKIKKKIWYQIIAPKLFNEQPLGETIVYDPQEMVGKSLSVNLMVLTNDIKKQNINVTFKVDKLEGSKGRTSMVGYDIVPSSVKRLVRRSRDKIDLSFVCKTADNALIRVKPVLITKANAKGSVLTKIRVKCIELCTRSIAKLDYEKFLEEILSHHLQESLIGDLKKIYPLKTLEIRSMEIVPSDRKVRVEKVREEIKEAPAEPAEEASVAA
ncbi:MAG TPA: hypothetical protein VJI46_04640 [Candidatus Nanoarchaeia archaeon]|nr:hypothetical protein [Candidatus Nanoarchaeia archaeon]